MTAYLGRLFFKRLFAYHTSVACTVDVPASCKHHFYRMYATKKAIKPIRSAVVSSFNKPLIIEENRPPAKLKDGQVNICS